MREIVIDLLYTAFICLKDRSILIRCSHLLTAYLSLTQTNPKQELIHFTSTAAHAHSVVLYARDGYDSSWFRSNAADICVRTSCMTLSLYSEYQDKTFFCKASANLDRV